MNRPLTPLAPALLGLLLGGPALAAVQASVDHSQLGPGDTVQLSLQRDGTTDSEPDVSPLRRDFDILGSSGGSSIQIINGHSSSQTQLILVLAPKHSGRLQIPALNWDGQQSPALTVDVSASAAPAPAPNNRSAPAAAPDDDVFVTADPDQPQPYVGSAVVLTVHVYTDRTMSQFSLDLPANADVQAQPLGKDEQHNEIRGGRSYIVFTRRYLLSPQHSGQLTLGGPVVDAQVVDNQGGGPFGNDPFFNNMFNSTRPLHLQGKPIVLNVRPRPSDGAGHDLLPAAALTLTESWTPGGARGKTGEPLTRHLHLSASGLSGAQLPDLSQLLQLPDGLKAYPDQAKTDTSLHDGKLMGSADQDIAIIASQPGHYELPAVHLRWWDSQQNVARDAVLPAHPLDITAATGAIAQTIAGQAAAVPAQPATGSSAGTAATGPVNRLPWPWISLGLALLWLITLAAWWRERRRPGRPIAATATPTPNTAPKPAPAGSLKAFQAACLANDAPGARHQLLAWADGQWPEQAPHGLQGLARRLDPGVAPLLAALDRACYQGGAWQGAALASALAAPPAPAPKAAPKLKLPDLYS